MKQLLTILLLFPLFIACSSDDDNNHGDTLEEQIVGQWGSTEQYSMGILVFSKDKTVRWYEKSTKDKPLLETKYTIYGDLVKFSHSDSFSSESYSGSVTDNILELTITSNGLVVKTYFKRK